MENSFKTSTKTGDKTKKTIRKEQLKAAKDLFAEANQISSETDQKDICNLLIKTSKYLLSHKYYLSDIRCLHNKLSNCLKSICDGTEWGFSDLKEFLTNHEFLIY